MMNSNDNSASINPNGINTQRIVELATQMSQDGNFGQFRFRADNNWINGSRSETRIKSFYAGNSEQSERTEPLCVRADQPAFLGGENSAPNAVEHYLNSLASCLNTTIVAHAAVQGIVISRLDISVEGEMDARGFFGVSEDASRGYTQVRATINANSNGDEESFKRLVGFSPVYEMVSKALPVDIILNIAPLH